MTNFKRFIRLCTYVLLNENDVFVTIVHFALQESFNSPFLGKGLSFKYDKNSSRFTVFYMRALSVSKI